MVRNIHFTVHRHKNSNTLRQVKKERSCVVLFQGVYEGREKVLQVELRQEFLTKNM